MQKTKWRAWLGRAVAWVGLFEIARTVVKYLFERAIRLVVVTVDLDWDGAKVLGRYLNRDRPPTTDAVSTKTMRVRPLGGRRRMIWFGRPYRTSGLHRWGGQWAYFKYHQKESKYGGNDEVYRLYYLRGRFDLLGLLRASEEWWDQQTKAAESQYEINHHFFQNGYSDSANPKVWAGNPVPSPHGSDDSETLDEGVEPLTWRRDDFGLTGDGDQVEDLAWGPTETELSAEIDRWWASEAWHRRTRSPWKIGVRLIGAPGTGKTSFVRAKAAQLDVPVHVFHLAGASDKAFAAKWEEYRGTKRIVLLEDFDTVFHGRSAVDPTTELTYDAILNALDGIERDHGLLLFITANNPEFLDEALCRDGRTELEVVFPHGVTVAQRRKIALRACDGDAVAAEALVVAGKDDATPAAFTKRCVFAARAAYRAEVEAAAKAA